MILHALCPIRRVWPTDRWASRSIVIHPREIVVSCLTELNVSSALEVNS